MSIRISISGTHSTGKSTLIEALRKETFFLGWVFLPGPTRTLREKGFPINNEAKSYNQTQLMCATIDVENLELKGNILQDRSLLDTLIYSIYLGEKGKVSPIILKSILSMFIELKDEYTVFIIPSSKDVELVQDGVRNDDIEFRDEIERLFFECLEAEKLPYLVVHGTTEERIKQIKKYIKENARK